ncbi:MAG: hypothetical protein C4617_01765 [Candidatus Liberibacter europaeus]|uniref:Uncharacterized protein n=1 Tax=Candidatus Liberibacter europaeus TaxID=744859 RepID=A0A2T4VXS1_9HYPH|nr:hypothetical protein [Candidatus Liberibacter europaeus]PTL86573.1 MAG: hypothetical protein C4617_01765 [Candidatus Liberibacter europaeus]
MVHITWTEILIIIVLCIIFCLDFRRLLFLVRNPRYLYTQTKKNVLRIVTGNISTLFSHNTKQENREDEDCNKQYLMKEQSSQKLSIDDDNDENHTSPVNSPIIKPNKKNIKTTKNTRKTYRKTHKK